MRISVSNRPAVDDPVNFVANIRTYYPLADQPESRHLPVDNNSVRNKMQKIGHARVSTTHQNLDRQIAALRSEGCDIIFREKASGRDTKSQPQLQKAIDAPANIGVLVVAEWDRATLSMLDGVAIIDCIHARGALLKVLDKPYLDLTTPIGRGFIAFLSAMAEDERLRIVSRANDGRRARQGPRGPFRPQAEAE